jgi:hypothetical protein
MPTLNTQFEHELKKRIEQRLVAIAEALSAGQAVKDYAGYMKLVGEFQGLKQITDVYCDEVTTTINTR